VPLRLDLIRHGDAVAAGSAGDASRTLSAIGRHDVTRLAEEYVRRQWRPRRVFVSPLRRAQETARILLDQLGGEIELETLEELDPSADGAELIAALRAGATVDHVVAIGHQPSLGHLAEALTGEEVAFPPAGMAWLEFGGALEAERGRLVQQVLPLKS
jgi:phosphohistidine phosphatase SixA